MYQDFLKTEHFPKNQIYFGLLLLTNDNKTYAISLGKSHFYLRDFCDSEFGLDLAERIVDYNNLRIKNTKLFGGNRHNNIIFYQEGSPVEYDSGESFQYIKAKTIDEAIWGKVVSFGTSVQSSLNIKPLELDKLIDRIESKLEEPPFFIFLESKK